MSWGNHNIIVHAAVNCVVDITPWRDSLYCIFLLFHIKRRGRTNGVFNIIIFIEIGGCKKYNHEALNT